MELEDITSRGPLSLDDDFLTRTQEDASEPFRATKETRSNTITCKTMIFFSVKIDAQRSDYLK